MTPTSTRRGRSGRRKKVAVRSGARPLSPWTVAGIIVLLLFAGGVGFGVYRAQQPSASGAPAGGTDTGIVVGQADAPVTVDIYLDFQCPACQAYEQRAGSTIEQLVASGRAKVVYHPVAYLNRFSSTRYSTRSSQAAACAADAGVFPQYLTALYANQPPENSAGLPDDQLVALGRQVGAGGDFPTCVADTRYAGWTAAVTDAASKAGINATPTVMVDGTAIDTTSEALLAAVQAAGR